jgi:RimJ/RimL family protein N-acetyltransferase
VRGTKVNPACKLALLEFGFEELGCVRIQLKTDGRNLHSQAAIRKLGAKEEGTLRKHGIMPDGFIRDTVFFSILPEEWPDVRANLLARLG